MRSWTLTTVPKKPADDAPKPVLKTTVKLAADVHKKLRTIASDRGLELSEFLDQILRPIADQGIKDLAKRITREGE